MVYTGPGDVLILRSGKSIQSFFPPGALLRVFKSRQPFMTLILRSGCLFESYSIEPTVTGIEHLYPEDFVLPADHVDIAGIPNTADIKLVILLHCLMAMQTEVREVPEPVREGLIKTLTQYKPADDDDESSQETSAVGNQARDVVDLAIRSLVTFSLQALEHRKTTDP